MFSKIPNDYQHKVQPTYEQKLELVRALVACSNIHDEEVRNYLVDHLPAEVKLKIQQSNVPSVHLANIADACLEHQYPKIFDLLMEAVLIFEDNTDAFKNLQETWSRIRPPKYQSLSHRHKLPVIRNIIYNPLGEHICINRRWECTTFDQMRSRDRTISKHILAFQVAGKKGKSLLLKRFNHVCKVEVSKGNLILYAKVDFRDRTLTPDLFVSEILEIFINNTNEAKNKFSKSTDYSAEWVSQLTEAYEKVINQLKKFKDEVSNFSGVATQSKKFQLQKLAEDFSTLCRSISDRWTVVLLLDTWEYAGMAGEWFHKYFIPRLVDLENVIAVLAGREGLLSLQSRPDEVIFRDNLEPMLYRDDCQRWAELKYGLKIDETRAEQIVRKYNGDMLQIDMALKVFNDFGILPKSSS